MHFNLTFTLLIILIIIIQSNLIQITQIQKQIQNQQLQNQQLQNQQLQNQQTPPPPPKQQQQQQQQQPSQQHLITESTSNPILIQKKNSYTTSNESTKKSFNYADFYSQTNGKFKPIIILLFIAWITFLFSFVSIVASEFFCPNLSTISSRLNLSESLAGVTLLGFGNGAPDVFSTFAAFRADTGSLAIGELVGASLFIVSVVVGTMSIVRPFRVPRHSFLRDIIFFIIAIIFVLIIIVDRGISPWQANALVLIYLTYVASVLLSSWSFNKIHHNRNQLRIARNLYSQDDQLLEPYHDDPDFPIQPTAEELDASESTGQTTQEEQDTGESGLSPQLSSVSQMRSPAQSRLKSISSSSSHSDSFKSLLETSYPISVPVGSRRMRAPSISYQSNIAGPPPPPPPHPNLLNSSTSANSPHLLRSNLIRSHSNEYPEAELNPSDNVQRRPRRNTMIMNGPIRPSLLGAIEFRDVVNSLNHDASVHSAIRTTSPQLTHRRPSSSRQVRSDSVSVGLSRGKRSNSPFDPSHRIPPIHHHHSTPSDHQLEEIGVDSRASNLHHFRALGHRRSSKSDDLNFPDSNSSESRFDQQKHVKQEERGRKSQSFRSNAHKSLDNIDPLQSSSAVLPLNLQSNLTSTPILPSILITTERHEIIQLPDTPSSHHRHQIHPPSTVHHLVSQSQRDLNRRKKLEKILGLVGETLFPTLKDLKIKSYLGIFLALFSAPAVFILTLTLPVVVDEQPDDKLGSIDDDNDDDDDDDDDDDQQDKVENHKVFQDDLGRSRLFSQIRRPQNHNVDPPHEEEPEEAGDEEIGLGLGCVLEGEEDLEINHDDVFQIKKSPVPVSEIDRKSYQPKLVLGEGSEGDGEDGVIVSDEAEDGEPIIEEEGEGEGEEEVAYSSQDVARILATVQTFLAPPFWVICLLDPGDDNHVDPSRLHHHTSNSTLFFNKVPLISSHSAANLFWLQFTASLFIGITLSKIVFETLKNPQENSIVELKEEEEKKNFLIKNLKNLKLKKIIKIVLCLIGFINSMIYILLIVNQLIQILNFFAYIFHISDSILGLTIFGIGNSLGDFVANFTVAKMGFPVMAISACFGGPMLNILLGIGVSAKLVMSSSSSSSSTKSSSIEINKIKNQIKIKSSNSLLISTIGLLFILIAMLLFIPFKKKSFLFDKSVGFSLILAYSAVFLVNVFVEIFF